MTNSELKALLSSLGADLCGIASLDRFAGAPEGFHPLDVFPPCKSVISFACRFPVAALSSPTHVVYTRVRNSISDKIDSISLNACIALEERGIQAVPIPAVESDPILRIIDVREHLRNLPQGHHPSVWKIAEAAESGIELAENQTIVSAHPRCYAA